MTTSWADALTDHVTALLVGRDTPLVVALDGQSGSGKSTLAAEVGTRIDALIIDGDDFYAGGTIEEWRQMTPAQRAEHCIDWRRQRPVLEALRRRESATWRAYDWERDDGSLTPTPVAASPRETVILEGAYSARPELADLVDVKVLLLLSASERQLRLRGREGEDYREEWEALWASAESHYFGSVMPATAFDLVLGDELPSEPTP